MLNHFKIAGLLLCVSLVSTRLWAQTLEPVVVSASRTEQKIADVLPSITVITKEEIQKRQAATLIDLLQGQMGLEISRSGGIGSTASLFIRGQASTNVAVFVDGVRMQVDAYGALKITDMPPSQIERIEILKGNVGALYGEAATGGAIHIFTHRQHPTSASIAYGSQQTKQAHLQHQIQNQDSRLSWSVQQLESKGASAMNPTQNAQVNPDRDAYRRKALALQAEKKLNSTWTIDLQAQAVQSQTQYDDPFAQAVTDTQELKTQTADISVSTQWQIRPMWKTRLTWTESEFKYRDFKNAEQVAFGGLSTGRQSYQQWLNTHIIKGGQLTWGIDDIRSHNQAYSNDYDRNTNAYYVGYNGQQGPIDYQINFRHDQIQSFSASQIKVVHKKNSQLWGLGYPLTPALKIMGLYSTSFRAPQPAELFGLYGNPDLQPQTHKGDEWGLQYRLPIGLWKTTYFRTQTQNDFAYGADYKPYNLAQTSNKGIETQLKGQWERWDYEMHYVKQNPINALDGSALLRRAKQYGGLFLGTWFYNTYWQARISHSSSKKEVGDRTLSSYTVADIFLSKKIAAKWTGRLKIENLFNQRYQSVYGYDAPSRGIALSFDYQH